MHSQTDHTRLPSSMKLTWHTAKRNIKVIHCILECSGKCPKQICSKKKFPFQKWNRLKVLTMSLRHPAGCWRMMTDDEQQYSAAALKATEWQETFFLQRYKESPLHSSDEEDLSWLFNWTSRCRFVSKVNNNDDDKTKVDAMQTSTTEDTQEYGLKVHWVKLGLIYDFCVCKSLT